MFGICYKLLSKSYNFVFGYQRLIRIHLISIDSVCVQKMFTLSCDLFVDRVFWYTMLCYDKYMVKFGRFAYFSFIGSFGFATKWSVCTIKPNMWITNDKTILSVGVGMHLVIPKC